MKWFGLTGGIASGKTTVTQLLVEHGVRVIDADVVARQVVEPGTAGLAAIVEAFGEDVLDERRALDRAHLAEIVFADREARDRLNAILHPAIAARTAELLAAARQEGLPFVVYDAALIVENGLHEMMDGLVVVHVPRDVQRERLLARDTLTREAAEQRLDAQLDPARKVAVADWVIDNSHSREATAEQVRVLVGQLAARASQSGAAH